MPQLSSRLGLHFYIGLADAPASFKTGACKVTSVLPIAQPPSRQGHTVLIWFGRCPSLLHGWGMQFHIGFADASAFF